MKFAKVCANQTVNMITTALAGSTATCAIITSVAFTIALPNAPKNADLVKRWCAFGSPALAHDYLLTGVVPPRPLPRRLLARVRLRESVENLAGGGLYPRMVVTLVYFAICIASWHRAAPNVATWQRIISPMLPLGNAKLDAWRSGSGIALPAPASPLRRFYEPL